MDGPAPTSTLTTAATASVSELPSVFSVKTLAERWTCSEQHVRQLISKGELSSFRYGKMHRIPVDAVLEREKANR